MAYTVAIEFCMTAFLVFHSFPILCTSVRLSW